MYSMIKIHSNMFGNQGSEANNGWLTVSAFLQTVFVNAFSV